MRSALPTLWLVALAVTAGCSGTEADADADSDADSDVGGDGDGDTDSDSDADAEEDAEADGDAEPDGGGDAEPDGGGDADADFDVDVEGLHFFLEMGTASMMGSPLAFAAAGFEPAALEDFAPREEPLLAVPLDGCVPTADLSSGPECATDRDCGPGQRCLPDTDDSGRPIAGTERCVTPTEMIDVGPFTMDGFEGGPVTFTYTPSQSGAYMAPPGDGSIPFEAVLFDSTYAFAGDGAPELGLGPFSGEVALPPEIVLTSPPIVDLPMGIPGIQVDPSVPLVLEWDGAVPGGELSLELNGNPLGTGTPMTCRVEDDGAFTVPVEVVEAVGFGGLAFFNMVSFERTTPGDAEGEGLTAVDVDSIQSVVISVARVGG